MWNSFYMLMAYIPNSWCFRFKTNEMARNNTLLFMMSKCFTIFQPDGLKNPNRIILMIFFGINGAFIAIANVVLIVGLLKTKRSTMTRTNKLFIILSISDLCVGLILMPLFVYQSDASQTISCLETQFYNFWSIFPLVLSGTHILVISMDRYCTVSKSNWYRKHFIDRIVLIIIATEVLISFSWAVAYYYVSRYFDLKKNGIYFLCLAIYEITVLICVVTCNVMIRNNVHRTVSGNSSLKREDGIHGIYSKKLSKTIRFVTITWVLCYAPSGTLLITVAFVFFYSTNLDDLRYTVIIFVWSLLPTCLNSALNSCIYISRNTKVRNYYKSILCEHRYHKEDRKGSPAVIWNKQTKTNEKLAKIDSTKF